MSLKNHLEQLTQTQIGETSRALQERLDQFTPEQLHAEVTPHILSYHALGHLIELVTEQAFADDCSIEEVAARGAGASHALLVLTTIAEIQELPTL